MIVTVAVTGVWKRECTLPNIGGSRCSLPTAASRRDTAFFCCFFVGGKRGVVFVGRVQDTASHTHHTPHNNKKQTHHAADEHAGEDAHQRADRDDVLAPPVADVLKRGGKAGAGVDVLDRHHHDEAERGEDVGDRDDDDAGCVSLFC